MSLLYITHTYVAPYCRSDLISMYMRHELHQPHQDHCPTLLPFQLSSDQHILTLGLTLDLEVLSPDELVHGIFEVESPADEPIKSRNLWVRGQRDAALRAMSGCRGTPKDIHTEHQLTIV